MGNYKLARQICGNSAFERFLGVETARNQPVVARRLVPEFEADARNIHLKLQAKRAQLSAVAGLAEFIEAGWEGPTLWVVYALPEGVVLSQVAGGAAGKTLAADAVRPIVTQVAATLAALHALPAPIVHGGVALGSVWLLPEGKVLLDSAAVYPAFIPKISLSARAESGTLAPEQLRGEWLPATDIFHLGLMAYELLTRRPLFPGDANDVAERCRTYRGPDLPQGLLQPWAALIPKMLSASPKGRPTALEVIAALPRSQFGENLLSAILSAVDATSYQGAALTGVRVLSLGAATVGIAPVPSGAAILGRIETKKMSRFEWDASRVREEQLREAEERGRPIDERLRNWLLRRSVVTADQIVRANEYRDDFGGTLAEALVALHACDEERLVSAIAEITKTPYISADALSEWTVPSEVLAHIPFDVAQELDAIPLELAGAGSLKVAMRDPEALPKLQEAVSEVTLVPVRASGAALIAARDRLYGAARVPDWLVSSTPVSQPHDHPGASGPAHAGAATKGSAPPSGNTASKRSTSSSPFTRPSGPNERPPSAPQQKPLNSQVPLRVSAPQWSSPPPAPHAPPPRLPTPPPPRAPILPNPSIPPHPRASLGPRASTPIRALPAPISHQQPPLPAHRQRTASVESSLAEVSGKFWTKLGAQSSKADDVVAYVSRVARNLGADEHALAKLEFVLVAVMALNGTHGRKLYATPLEEEIREHIGEEHWPEVENTLTGWLHWPHAPALEPEQLGLCLGLGLLAHTGLPLPDGPEFDGAVKNFARRYRLSSRQQRALAD